MRWNSLSRLTLMTALVAGSAMAAEAEFDLGAPITDGRLTLYPLLPKGPVDDSDYLTLDEALDKKLLRVAETSESGTVNTLHVTSTAKGPIFAMAGELLLGGKQDRIVGQAVVIPAGAKGLAVPVFCVEHGRWNGGDGRFGSGKALVHTKLRQTASFKGQGDVWNEVAKTNAKLSTQNATDTYRAAQQKLGKETASGTKRVLAALDKAGGKVVGVAVAVGNDVRSVEAYISPKLWGRLREKILASYVGEALADAGPVGEHLRRPSEKDVQAFMTRAVSAKKDGEKNVGGGKQLNFDDSELQGQAVMDARPEAADKAKKPVQRVYYKK